MKPTLRLYQERLNDQIREALWKYKRVLAVMPTGAGKGTTIGAIVAGAAARGRRVLVLAHRSELIDQLSDSLKQWEVEHGIIRPGAKATDHNVQVGSVQTVAKRLDAMPEPALIVIDEAHHCIPGNTWGAVVDRWPNAFLIGKTATPSRLGGEPLGKQHGGYFEKMILGPTPQWLTDNWYLARARIFAPPNSFNRSALRKQAGDYRMSDASTALSSREIMGDVVGHFKRHLQFGTAIAFCCSVQHAEDVAAAFCAAGIASASIDGKMTPVKRRELLKQLERRELRVLTSCALIGEGINIPNVDGALLLRPTQSLALHLQMIGRCLRPAENKEHAVILDHVGNCIAHGLPTDHRQWSLEGRVKRLSDAPPVRVCPKCYAANPGGSTFCLDCGFEFPPPDAAEILQVDGELAELFPMGLRLGDPVEHNGKRWYIASRPFHGRVVLAETRARATALRNKAPSALLNRAHTAPVSELRKPKHPAAGAASLEELLTVERERGFKPGWARHIWAARQRKRAAA